MSEQEQVTITKDEYENLKRDKRKLDALERNGVDNWEWYGDAMSSIDEEAQS
jgi:hypothetical protein